MAITCKMWISLTTGDLVLLFGLAGAWSHGAPGHLSEKVSDILDQRY